MPLHGQNPSSGIFLSPFHSAQRGILICRSFLHNIFQNRTLLLRQLLIPDLQLRTHKGGEHIQIGTRHSHCPLCILEQFQSIRIIRRTVCIILVRFPYGMEDSVSSPVRDLTEIIFFLYLHGFQRL